MRSSNVVIGHSDTHFTVPYTDAFTDIGSTTALIDEQPDAGYSSELYNLNELNQLLVSFM